MVQALTECGPVQVEYENKAVAELTALSQLVNQVHAMAAL